MIFFKSETNKIDQISGNKNSKNAPPERNYNSLRSYETILNHSAMEIDENEIDEPMITDGISEK